MISGEPKQPAAFGTGQAADRPLDPAWAWTPYAPSSDRPWNLRGAGHLFRRAAFGARWSQLDRALAEGPQRTIDRLLHPDGDVATFNRSFDETETAAASGDAADEMRAWWLRRMIETPHPLLENLTLFWHHYFAIGNARVHSARLLCRHVQQLRQQALGSFAVLLESILSDPAIFLGLDAAANRKARPRPFLARVLLEQWTVGPGHFTEHDLQETARAFTGWLVLRDELRYVPREHDPAVKRILGQEGPFASQDVVRILLEQPTTPRGLVRKLYRWLISETSDPGEALMAPLADALAKDYSLGKVVETMLRSNLFFSPAAYRQKIKGPVEFAVGIVRGLEATVGTTRLGADLAALGQDLCQPPTIKGWAGSRCWINPATLLGRSRLAQGLVGASDAYNSKLDPLSVARKYGHSSDHVAARFLMDLFLQGDLPPAARAALHASVTEAETVATPALAERMRRMATLLAALPEFHLA
jgi:uncharacterized protein (DUF1800 family)